MANTYSLPVSEGLTLDVKFTTEQGQKFFPITHRKAIMGLSVNTLTLSESLEIDVSEADNTITINPVVQLEIDKIYNNITTLETTIKNEINTQIENLWSKVNNMNYALSQSPGGPANTALKLNSPFTLTILGDATGSVSMDGSKNVSCNVTVSKTRNNYAGAAVDQGAANSAVKLDTARIINLTGAVTGRVSFDGTTDVTIDTVVNHTHSQYSLTTHNHDTVYSKLGHTHNYAGSSSVGGVATSAAKLATARSIAINGAVTGSADFDGSGNIAITTSVNHTHNQYSLTSHNHDSVYSKLGHTHSYLPTGGGTMSGNLNNNANYQQNGVNGKIVAVQSGGPNGAMMWAW